MRSRWIAFATIALVVSACTAAAEPTASPAATVITTPGASLAATATATSPASSAASPSPAQVPPGVRSTATSAVDSETLTLICRTTDSSPHEQTMDPAGVACPQIIHATLAILGQRAKDVVRVQAGSVCASPCTDSVIVGFSDGHLEAAAADWELVDGVDQGVAIAPFHPAEASVWPWGDAATFDSPAVARPTFLLSTSAELTKRTPLPHCGVDTVSSGTPDLTAPDGTNPGARRCFASAVLTGHPAEYVSQASDAGGLYVSVERFTGSGPVLAYYRHDIPPDNAGWGKPEPSLIYIGKNDYVWFHPIAPVGFQ
jgi:hypothetical protein